jgi:sterol desaturase/sphingolipid hydroxylase (fatty acid hydroxylase superfamily)
MIEDHIVPALVVALLLVALLEYVIHRWVMHGRRCGKFFREHTIEHHARRRNGIYVTLPLRTSLKVTAPLAVLLLWWPVLSVALLAVAVVHCGMWTALHHSFHDTGHGWVRRIPGWSFLQRHHLEHHRNPHVNFGGVFGPCLDLVFRTTSRNRVALGGPGT